MSETCDSNDWEPLAADRLAAHPGELVVVPKQAVAPAPKGLDEMWGDAPSPSPAADTVAEQRADTEPKVVAKPKPRRVAEPIDPAAEKVLQELKNKIARRPAARSLISEVQRREAKAERQQRAAANDELQAVTPVRPEATAQKPSPFEFEAVEDTRDVREDEEWFRRLPEAERARLKAAWQVRSEQLVADGPGQRRWQRDRFVAALVLFGTVLVLGSGSYKIATVGASIWCGIWWRHAAACRFRDPIIALVCFGVAQGIAWMVSTDDMPHPGLINDVMLMVTIGGLIGMTGEMRRSGGFTAG